MLISDFGPLRMSKRLSAGMDRLIDVEDSLFIHTPTRNLPYSPFSINNSNIIPPHQHLSKPGNVHDLTSTFIFMSYFTYKLIGKTPEVDATRRSTSDWYANLAQLSQLLFILAMPKIRTVFATLFQFLLDGTSLEENLDTNRISVPKSSRQAKALRLSRPTRVTESTLSREVKKRYSSWELCIYGLTWAAWLGFLCIHNTAPGT
jgi:hypothetical protein